MIEKIGESYVDRIQEQLSEINEEILKSIGKKIKLISTLTPTQAMQIISILKYGGSYEEIRNKISKIANKSLKEIDKMFVDIAKENQYFAKQFYKYKNIPFVPLEKNEMLKSYISSFSTLAKLNYTKMLNSNMLGYGLIGKDGTYQLLGVKDTINYIIDKATMSLTQGKSTFYQEMRNTLKQLGGSGLRMISGSTYIDKEGTIRNHSRRLDSSIRMYLLESARTFSNNVEMRFGEEYGADGIEISVHENPAPDHAPIQGRQFTNEEFVEIQAGKYGRAIGELNCYHYIFAIVLGVSKPEYSEEQLKQMEKDNQNGFNFQGKHYTKYEGTQLQRRLETEIRKQKDTQILAKASGDMELVADSQRKITILNHKYKQLCEVSGLKPKKERMTVSGYVRTKVDNIKEKVKPVKLTDTELDEKFYMLSQDLDEKNITIDNTIFNIEDKELRNRQLEQLNNLTDSYNHNMITRQKLILKKGNTKQAIGKANMFDHSIKLGDKYFNDKDYLIDVERKCAQTKWHYKTSEKDYDIYTITHEYGHIMEYEYLKEKLLKKNILPAVSTLKDRRIIDSELADTLLDRAIRKSEEKITRKQFKEKYWSGYSKSKRNFEWFAESFAQANLTNESNIWIDTFKEWLDEFYK